jgi:uncharacterized protein (TIGR04551 family)
MRRWSLLLVPVVMAMASPAFAQFGGGPGGGGMRPGGPGTPGAPGGTEEKEEGPAEAAPEQQAENPALQPLPAWPQQQQKQLQFFQLNGYIRFRSYLFHALNMGMYGGTTPPYNPRNPDFTPRSPFPIPYTEWRQTGNGTSVNGVAVANSSCFKRDGTNCRTDNLTSADMRLRLEPTINVTEQVRVHAQLDIFDNLVLGSTPQGYYINGGTHSQDVPYAFAATSQVAPQPGVNSVYDSVRAKRAWAEVHTPIAELRFGRMPSHWGTGMMINDGSCFDCDYGVNADRVMAEKVLWGHFFSFMWDWVATGPTTQIIGPQQGQGVFYNADTVQNVSQWILALGKRDSLESLKEKLDAGKTVFNYGGYFAYRQQDWDQSGQLNANYSGSGPPGTLTPSENSESDLQRSIQPRHAKEFVPDIWLRLNWKKLHIEAEGAMMVGTIGNLTDVYRNYAGQPYLGSTSILSGAFVVKADYKLLHDALKLYLEVGYASGDDAEDPTGAVNFRQASLTPYNNHIGRFFFDPDYHVDLILFRRILGTVNNATYFKPGVQYDIYERLFARADVMYALANRPVAYPGNNINLGLEIDAELMYKNEDEGFYAGLVYGVLIPFAGLGQPASIFGGVNAKDSPDIAQTFQARLIVKF